MSNKVFIFIVVLIFCIVVYSVTIIQIRNNVDISDKRATELEEESKILENANNSIKNQIETLVSIQNLNKIAEEKNLKKPTKEQTIELTNDKLKEK